MREAFNRFNSTSQMVMVLRSEKTIWLISFSKDSLLVLSALNSPTFHSLMENMMHWYLLPFPFLAVDYLPIET